MGYWLWGRREGEGGEKDIPRALTHSRVEGTAIQETVTTLTRTCVHGKSIPVLRHTSG